jgi:hypothetical protein
MDEISLVDQTSIHMPAGVTHEFWNRGAIPA